MNSLALTARASPPRRNGALVKPKRRYDRLHGAPVGQQGHDEHHRLRRGAQPIEDRAFAGTEGLVTRMADEALLLLRMDTDVALARLASGRAVLIGAECRGGGHACPPSNGGERTKRSMSGPPFALQVHLPTVACGATSSPNIRIKSGLKASISMRIMRKASTSRRRCSRCAETPSSSPYSRRTPSGQL